MLADSWLSDDPLDRVDHERGDRWVLAFLILNRWRELNQGAATGFAEQHQWRDFEEATDWRSVDLASALAAAREAPAPEPAREKAPASEEDRVYLWAIENPEAAAEWLLANDWIEPEPPDPDADPVADPFAPDPDPAPNDGPNPYQHNRKIEIVFNALLERDLPSATAAAARLGRSDLVRDIIRQRRFHDPVETVRWLEQVRLPPSDDHFFTVWRRTISYWYDRDPAAASAWLASQEDGKIRHAGIYPIVDRLTTGPDRDFAAALEWVPFAEPESHERLTSRILRDWREADPQAAAEFFSEQEEEAP